ncbi:hypothetical protein ZWY2020_040894 [Hordeum vulgare]|nr:hypothetical protein ZWY2020_040894 [Hordeum vulgare]
MKIIGGLIDMEFVREFIERRWDSLACGLSTNDPRCKRVSDMKNNTQRKHEDLASRLPWDCWYAAANEVKKAVKTFDVMERFKVEADQTVFYSLLRALCRSKNIEDAEELLLARRNFSHSQQKIGNLFDTLRVYNEMKKKGWSPRIDVYNQLIYVLTRENCVKDAKNVLSKMVDEGFQPDVETYNNIIVPLCESCKLEEAHKIMEDMKMKGIVPTISTYHAFLKQEGIDETLQLLKKMKEDGCGPNGDTFLMLIDKFIQLNESRNAVSVWTEMRRYDIRPGYAHYMAVVQETIGEEQADTILFHNVPNILQAGQEFHNTCVTVKGLLCMTEVNVIVSRRCSHASEDT